MKSLNEQVLLDALQTVLKKENDEFISLHEPLFIGNEWNYIRECLDTGWVSSVGKFVDRFEYDLAKYTGAKRAIAVVNGTAALHICLKLIGVEAEDEVLLPTMTFVATANAVTYCGAIPHFVDSHEKTLGIDPEKLGHYLDSIAEVKSAGCWNRETKRWIKALIPVHTFGHPVDLDALDKICQHFKLTLIEDAAESLGSLYKGRHTGNWGKVSAISFNGNKILTTGAGGAILTQDDTVADLAKHITTTAKLPHKWAFNHDQVGYNYRMPNLNAALGCAQLEMLPKFILKKRNLANSYLQAFHGIEGLRFFVEPDFAQSNYWLNVLLLDETYEEQRDNFLEVTNQKGIMTRPAWTLMHHLPMFKDFPQMDLSQAETLAKRIINIPSSVKWSK